MLCTITYHAKYDPSSDFAIISSETRGPYGPDIAHWGVLPLSIQVFQWMVHGLNLQLSMQSPGILETSLVI